MAMSLAQELPDLAVSTRRNSLTHSGTSMLAEPLAPHCVCALCCLRPLWDLHMAASDQREARGSSR